MRLLNGVCLDVLVIVQANVMQHVLEDAIVAVLAVWHIVSRDASAVQ